MKKPIDELYLSWLYSRVAVVRLKDPSKTYWKLLRQLYVKEFVWIVPNDDNRVEDGRDLRYLFLNDADITEFPEDWLLLQCSMLEMLIGLANRLAFEVDGSLKRWFWEMLDNVHLAEYHDGAYFGGIESEVDETCDRIIWRNYNSNGSGGLFPLNRPMRDQRKVELWYQLNAYLLERE